MPHLTNAPSPPQLEGHDSDPSPILLNPAHALVGMRGRDKDTAIAFAEWMVREDGGQKVVNGFAVGGVVLYTKAAGGTVEGEGEYSALDFSLEV